MRHTSELLVGFPAVVWGVTAEDQRTCGSALASSEFRDLSEVPRVRGIFPSPRYTFSGPPFPAWPDGVVHLTHHHLRMTSPIAHNRRYDCRPLVDYLLVVGLAILSLPSHAQEFEESTLRVDNVCKSSMFYI